VTVRKHETDVSGGFQVPRRIAHFHRPCTASSLPRHRDSLPTDPQIDDWPSSFFEKCSVLQSDTHSDRMSRPHGRSWETTGSLYVSGNSTDCSVARFPELVTIQQLTTADHECSKGKPVARPQTVSDAQILNTALECFLQHGPEVSTETIARQLNVSPQALLKRFGTKQKLMMSALKQVMLSTSVPELLAEPDDRPVEQQLTELMHQVSVFYIEMARRMSVVRWKSEDFQELMKQYDEPPPLQNMKLVAAWLERASGKGLIRKCDFRGIALMLLTSLHGAAMLTDMLGRHPSGHTSSAYVKLLVKTLLHGIESSPARTSRPKKKTARHRSRQPANDS